MANFINTIDVLGDDAVIDSIIDRTITEFNDDTIETVGNSAFCGCTALGAVRLPSVTEILNSAFRDCTSLKAITPDTFPKVKAIAKNVSRYAFQGCSGLESISWPSLEQLLSSQVFDNCTSLQSVDLPNLTAIDTNTFKNCGNLTAANMPKLEVLGDSTFASCRALQSVTLPKVTALNGYSCFWGCAKIEVVDLPLCASIPGGKHFQMCTALKALILRNAEAVCTLENTNSFSNNGISNGTGYVYVPRALVDSYKAATNWSTYATRFRALEDYTVDGTITGALDETKI